MKKIIIGIGEGSKYANYANWIKNEPELEIIKLGYNYDNLAEIDKCHGILLTGGSDVNPRIYNQPDFLTYCDPNDIDEKRDEFEWKIMQHVEETQKPLLGICRGMHFANVFYGGTLIPDIPAFGKFNHAKVNEEKDRQHDILLDSHSELYKITGDERGLVNSAHHQGVDMPGFGLVATAFSNDGIIEAMERRAPEDRSYFLLVQWHPERMQNKESIFAKNIKNSFLQAVRNSIQ
ncbi:MAG: gamma-glutamyl-gamma-aminobutyrate hydrolase family protein [Ginsengibacter sp.]